MRSVGVPPPQLGAQPSQPQSNGQDARALKALIIGIATYNIFYLKQGDNLQCGTN